MSRPALFTIKHDFTAEEPTELSVSQGEAVHANEHAPRSGEPWTLVETAAPPFHRGFVPTSYLVPASSGTGGGALGASPMERDARPSTGVVGGPAAVPRRLSDPRLPDYLLDALSINPPSGPGSGSGLGLGGSGDDREASAVASSYEMQLRPFQTSHASLFAQHDRAMQQVMHARHEHFKVVEEGLVEMTRRLEATKTRAQDLAAAMGAVNAIIEGERRRWKERIAQDAAARVDS